MIMSDSNTPLSRYPYDEYVASVEGPDPQTVVVHFTAPFAPWVATIFTYVLPEHVLRPVFEEDLTLDSAEWNRAPSIGSGPYVFDEWETGSYVRFARSDNFYGPAPIIDVIAITFIPDAASYVIALENEDAMVGTFIAYSDVPALQETGKVTISMVPSGYNEALFFNVNPETGHPALQDVNVRRAIAMGFNREQITNDLLLGLTYPEVSFWENTPYANTDLEGIPYDPDQANQLLDEAGWVDDNDDGIREKDGQDLQLRWVTNTRQIRLDTAVVAQQQLREIGVDLVLENYPSDVFFNGYGDEGPVARGNYDIAEWSASPLFPDPDTSRFRCSQIPTEESPDGANWTGYCDEELDTLFDQQATEMDYDARVDIFHQIDEQLNAAVVWVGVWHDPDIWVVNNKVQNAQLNGATPFWNIYEWDLSE
jgi:ABC-type transport system substrate-binding protein